MARLVPEQIDDAAARWGPVRGLLFRPVAAGRRRLLRARGRHQVGRRSSRWRRSGCWSGCGAPAPGAPSASAGPVLKSALVDGVPAFVHLVLVAFVVYVATWTGWLVHAHAVRGAPLRDAVHPATSPLQGRRDRTSTTAGRPPPSRTRRARRGDAVAAVALVLPPGRLRLPHPLPQLQHAHLRLEAVRLAAAQPAGRRRRRHRHPARHPGLRRARGQRLPAPGAAARHPDDLVGRRAWRCSSPW